jgi:hypothetical protein
MTTFQNDYSYGIDKENSILATLNNFFKRDISKSKDVYSNYDFSDTKYKYELKSRRNKYNAYPTTLIPKLKCKPNTILLFNFTDGLYYIKYNTEKFEKFDKKYFKVDRDDKIDVNKEYYYVPINQLKLITRYYDEEIELDF